MPNLESAHLFTYNYFWKFNKKANTKQQLNFNKIDIESSVSLLPHNTIFYAIVTYICEFLDVAVLDNTRE